MRTIEDIRDEIIAEKEAQSALNGLTSSSATAVWRLWVWITATAIYTHEQLWRLFRSEVDTIVESATPGTAQWYRNQALIYQHGDDLVYENERFRYPVIDATKQIIARASVSEAQGQVFIKTARINPFTGLGKLTEGELSAFTAYINKIKFAGTQTNVISIDPDLLRIDLDVYYDAKLLNASGQLITDTSVVPVEDAVNNYLASIGWDGSFIVNHLIDAVQAAVGVIDVTVDEIKAKSDAETSYATVNRIYSPASGYFIIDNLSITYHV